MSWFFKKSIFCSRGSMLFQVLGLSLLISAGSIYLIMKLKDDKKLINQSKFNSQADQITHNIELTLMDSAACLSSFGNNPPGNFSEIRIPHRDISVGTAIAFRTYSGGYSEDDETIIEPNIFGEPGSRLFIKEIEVINDGGGRGKLEITFEKLSRDANNKTIFGGDRIKKEIDLSLNIDGTTGNITDCFSEPGGSFAIAQLIETICDKLGDTTNPGLICNPRPIWEVTGKEHLCNQMRGSWDGTNCNYNPGNYTPINTNAGIHSYMKTFITGFNGSDGSFNTCTVNCKDSQYTCGGGTVPPSADDTTCGSGFTCEAAHSGTTCPAPRSYICGNPAFRIGWVGRQLLYSCHHEGFRTDLYPRDVNKKMPTCSNVVCLDCSSSVWCSNKAQCRDRDPIAWDLECNTIGDDKTDDDDKKEPNCDILPTTWGSGNCAVTIGQTSLEPGESKTFTNDLNLGTAEPHEGSITYNCEDLGDGRERLKIASETCSAPTNCVPSKNFTYGECTFEYPGGAQGSAETLTNTNSSTHIGKITVTCNKPIDDVTISDQVCEKKCLAGAAINWTVFNSIGSNTGDSGGSGNSGSSRCTASLPSDLNPGETIVVTDNSSTSIGSTTVSCNPDGTLTIIENPSGLSSGSSSDSGSKPTCIKTPSECFSENKKWGKHCKGTLPITKVGKNATIICSEPGYTGSATFRCLEDGTWEPSPIPGSETCDPKKNACPPIELTWRNTLTQSSADNQGCVGKAPETKPGEVITIKSLGGLFEGSAKFKCKEDGTWSARPLGNSIECIPSTKCLGKVSWNEDTTFENDEMNCEFEFNISKGSLEQLELIQGKEVSVSAKPINCSGSPLNGLKHQAEGYLVNGHAKVKCQDGKIIVTSSVGATPIFDKDKTGRQESD